MKKLSLKNLKFEASEIVRRNQLKTVLGGYNPGCACGHQCDSVGSNCTVNGRSGTCRNGHCDGCRTRLYYA